jgi:hypothetical protein
VEVGLRAAESRNAPTTLLHRRPHNVAFRFHQLLGPLEISVDGEAVIRKFEMFSLRHTGRYEFPVGSTEPHEVRIGKTRQALMGGLQAQECVTYVEIGRYSDAA